jgi:hypothetical protein
MKQTTFATSLTLLCSIAAVPAQRTPEPAAQPAHNVFVLTGCLERGSAPSAFKLTRASVIGQAPPRPSSSTAAPAAKGEEGYELQGTSGVAEQGLSSEKLQPEVGTRVEVTIRPIEAPAPAPPQPASANTAEKPTESPRPRYTVVKLNRLAGSCT